MSNVDDEAETKMFANNLFSATQINWYRNTTYACHGEDLDFNWVGSAINNVFFFDPRVEKNNVTNCCACLQLPSVQNCMEEKPHLEILWHDTAVSDQSQHNFIYLCEPNQ